MKPEYLGLDIGSISIKIVLMDEQFNVHTEKYIRHNGQPLEVSYEYLSNIFKETGIPLILSVTGSGGKIISELVGVEYVNEIIAQYKSTERFYPDIKTIIEIGGEDSKLILLTDKKVEDFAMNTICAAGTGSFLEQQASRLNMTVDEFGKIGLQSKNPSRIAGRCGVFAKTDMIHLQQKGTPVCDIAFGVCLALARNFKSGIGRGKKINKPISIQGGVAANKGMIRAFEEIFNLTENDIIIPKYFTSMGAIGSVLVTGEKTEKKEIGLHDIEKLKIYLKEPKHWKEKLAALSLPETKSQKNNNMENLPLPNKMKGYLGIDIGSVSLNVAVIDENKNLIAKCYLPTAGNPIRAVRNGLKGIAQKTSNFVEIEGVCTTGSGRYIAADFVGADIVKNEITCQARAALEINPEVDTIFEIGGQDSKFIRLKEGVVVDFEMNNVCAAGTGSFLEEQAQKLNIKIRQEFGDIALESKNPVFLGDRCTVFMETELVHFQQKGCEKRALVAGLCYSIVYNYLNKVVGRKKIGENIFFQGGVAGNRGVVAAFNKVLNKNVTVPQNHEVTGALGAALVALENICGRSKFKGWDIAERGYTIESFECQDCANHCEINKLVIENEEPLFYGSRCGKYDIRKRKELVTVPDLFAEREKMMFNAYLPHNSTEYAKKKVGIPRILFFHEYFPFWNAFFRELGYEVVLSPKTNKDIVRNGLELSITETCFPIKVSYGHIQSLIRQKVDYIFLPSIINMPSNKNMRNSYGCPYAQTIPYMAESIIDFKDTKVLKPVIHWRKGKKHLISILLQLGRKLSINSNRVRKAVDIAQKTQEKYYKNMLIRGKDILDSDDKALVLVGRPYNSYDREVNLDITKILRGMNILVIPMDFLPFEDIDISEKWPNMYWKYGERILSAIEFINENKNLYPVYLTNFACGPDSFLLDFFKKAAGDKPYLQIGVDEHGGETGVITRCEAFWDSLMSSRKPTSSFQTRQAEIRTPKEIVPFKKLYIPYMCDNAHTLKAAFEAFGINAEVMPEPDEETIRCGRKFTSGKECYPCTITIGDMIKTLGSENFNQYESAFLIPSGSGPCRFGQYYIFHRLILDELGYNNVKIFSPHQDRNVFKQIGSIGGSSLIRLAWQGSVACDVLDKIRRETRPYEINIGETERIYQNNLKKVCTIISRKENPAEVLKAASHEFRNIKLKNKQGRPVVGIVGEIFIRSNNFSNNNIITKIEQLGAEVWIPPVGEWFLYLTHLFRKWDFQEKKLLDYVIDTAKEMIQRHDEQVLNKSVRNNSKYSNGTCIKELLQKGTPYLDPTFTGEAILSVGKSIEFMEEGVSGIINVMPFMCMPGTIVTTLMKKIREDNNNIPCLTIAYDGLEQITMETRLEAFIYQVKQYQKGG